MSQRVESGVPINFTSDQIVSKARGTLLGFYVNSTSSGTIVIYNDQSAVSANALSGTITPAIGFHRFPAYCPNGCFIAVTGGSGNLTAFFAAG